MIGVGKEDQASKLPFVPYHTECKYDQVFTTGYNEPHLLSSFFSFPWETWHFSPFPYSCFLLLISLFLFSTPVQIHQRPASWLSCSFNIASMGLGKTPPHPHYWEVISAAAVCWFLSPVTIPCWEEPWVWVSQRAPGMSLFQASLVDRARNSVCVNNKPV